MIEYDAVFKVGTTENVNVEPPFEVDNANDTGFVYVTAKSEATAVVGPIAPKTPIVHVMGLPTRGVVPATQVSTDAIVGVPNTGKEMNPPFTVAPSAKVAMVNAVVVVNGVVENVNVTPPSNVEGTIDEALDEMVKSAGMPVVGPELPKTTMVQLTLALTRTGDT